MGAWILIAAAAAPQARAVEPAALAAAPPAVGRGVIAYPPAFFAEAQPTTAYDMVIRLPGFTFDKGATVRGLAGSAGNVLIDGQPPVSKNDTLEEFLKRIPAGSVERIDLIRGGAPGIDMDGRSVMANVVRKQVAGFKAAVAPTTNLLYDGRVLNSIRAEGQWRWPGGRSVELQQVFGRGPNEELGDGVRTRFNANGSTRLRSKVDADSGGQRIYTIGAFETPLLGGRIRVNGAYQLNPSYVELYDRIVGGGKEYEYNKVDRTQIETGLRFSRPLNPATNLEVIAFRQMNNSDTFAHFEAPGLTRDFRLDRESTEMVGRVTLKRRQTPRLSFEGSVEGALNKLDSATTLAVNARSILVPAANVQFEEKRAELTGRATWRALDTLTLEGGLRQERSTLTSKGDVILEKTLQFTKPRLAATWAVDPLTQVRLRLEREVGQLNFDDFVATSNVASTGTLSAGNPDLTPQQAWVYEAAVERRFWGAGSIVLTVRHYALSDVVDRAPVFGPTGAILADAPGNIGAGTRNEYSASVNLPLDRLGLKGAQLRGSITRRDTEVTDPLTGLKREISVLRSGDTREGSPVSPVSWDIHYTQDLPFIRTVWGADIIGGFRETAYRLSEIETRKISTTILLFAEYKAASDLTLRVEAQAMNQRNARRIREVYIGPRTLGRLDYTDVRNLEWGGSLFFRVRKTFG